MATDGPAVTGERRAVAKRANRPGPPVDRLEVHAFTIPAGGPDDLPGLRLLRDTAPARLDIVTWADAEPYRVHGGSG